MLTPLGNLFLVGYRGSGKSTVARLVAERLEREAIDTDEVIERRAGRTIAQIFADDGEAAFRVLEAAVLDELSRVDRRVLSLGGGIVLRPGNRAKIKARGHAVFLTASAETLWRRISQDTATALRRPNLTAVGGPAEVAELLARRLPAYRECAYWVVDTEGKTAQAVADEIVELVQGSPAGKRL